MAYCVNCGVKLSKSEKKCPLCNTLVINPNNVTLEYVPAYPSKIENYKKINYNYLFKLITSILIILAIITVFCNLITTGEISWSIYVVISIFYLSSHFSFIFHKKIYIPLIIELISTELFIFIIAILNGGMHWYLYLVLPFIFILWLYIMLCTSLIKRKNGNILRKISFCLLFSSFTLIIIEACTDLYNNSIIKYNWSIYAVLPIVIISILIYMVSLNKKLIDEIKQRIFI